MSVDLISVRVVDRDGTFYGRLRTANVGTLIRPLNGLDRAPLSFSATDPTAALLLARVDADPANDILGVLHREVELWVNGTRRLQGPCVDIEIGDDGLCDGTIMSFAWWLFQRAVGRADRQNGLSNGGFETGDFTDWTTTGSPAVVTSPVYTGTYSAELDDGEAVSQDYTFTHTYGPGLDPVFAAGIYFPTGSDAPANDVWFTIEADDNPGALTEIDYEPTSVPRDAWVEVSFTLGRPLPPGSYTVTITAHGGNNTINVDNVRAVQPESIGADYGGSDPAAVATLLVEYMQDTAHGKDDLGITATTHATSSRTDTVWQDADHEEFGRALAQLTDIKDGIDWWCDYSNRSIHFAAVRGSFKPQYTLRSGSSLVKYRVRVDGTEVKNSAVVIGVGQNFSRDEGGFIATNDLPITEIVEHAPVSMPLREYDLWAQEIAEQRSRPVESISGAKTTWGLSMLGSIEPGDTVPVQVRVGQFTSIRTYRVVGLLANFETGLLEPTLSAVA